MEEEVPTNRRGVKSGVFCKFVEISFTPFEAIDLLKIAKEGWLMKEGRVRKSWKTRWLVLTDEGDVSYYKNPKVKITPLFSAHDIRIKSRKVAFV